MSMYIFLGLSILFNQHIHSVISSREVRGPYALQLCGHEYSVASACSESFSTSAEHKMILVSGNTNNRSFTDSMKLPMRGGRIESQTDTIGILRDSYPNILRICASNDKGVYSCTTGVVAYVHESESGKFVIIKTDAFFLSYAMAFSCVKKGQKIEIGQQIGRMADGTNELLASCLAITLDDPSKTRRIDSFIK